MAPLREYIHVFLDSVKNTVAVSLGMLSIG